MTDPYKAFRRPGESNQDDDNVLAPEHEGSEPMVEPLILDPELHESVWKPWQGSTASLPDAAGDGETAPRRLPGMGKHPTFIIGLAAAALVLILVMVVPQLRDEPTWPFQPLVQDIATQPVIAWTSEAGESCLNQSDGDHAILSSDEQVWALDLTDGSTLWSAEFDGWVRVTCLPGADLVAVSIIGPQDETVLRTMLLDASTGVEMEELPGSASVHVLPLGPLVGLVDDSDVLSAVDPDDLGTPLWSRQLPSLPVTDAMLYSWAVDDDVVQLVSFSYSGADDENNGFILPLTVSDGSSPPWAQPSSTDFAHHQHVGNVILRFDEEAVSNASVLDLQGEQLWDLGDNQLGVADSRLFVSWPSGSDPATGYSNLHEVDPRTGKALTGDKYRGWFNYAFGVRDHIAVSRHDTLHILSRNMEEQPQIAVESHRTIHEGRNLVYVTSQPNFAEERLTAIDLDGANVAWTLDLTSGQSVHQLASHLVVMEFTEDGEVFHGLATQ